MTAGNARSVAPSLTEVRSGRRLGRQAVLEQVSSWAVALPSALEVQAVVIFGSYARGDWNEASDIDVLVVAGHLPSHPTARLHALGPRPPRVEVVVWEPSDYLRRRGREPITVEAERSGVWALGSPAAISTPESGG